ncbi:MAG: hypothetical protein ABJA79_09240 [Parafilimonas sp.]
MNITINQDELDFAKSNFKTSECKSSEDLLKKFDENLAKAIKDLQSATDEF